MLRPMCGQAMLSAADTVMALAMMTTEHPVVRGWTHQGTEFFSAAKDEPLLLTARVLKAGRRPSFGQVEIVGEHTGKLVAHVTAQFAGS